VSCGWGFMNEQTILRAAARASLSVGSSSMQDLGVIDQFTNVFFAYIDTGFGLLRGEVGF